MINTPKFKAGERVVRGSTVYKIVNMPFFAEDGREYAPVRRYLTDPIPMLIGPVSHQRTDELRAVKEESTYARPS